MSSPAGWQSESGITCKLSRDISQLSFPIAGDFPHLCPALIVGGGTRSVLQYAEAATPRKYPLPAAAMLTQLELAAQTLRLLNITADRRRHLRGDLQEFSHRGSEVFRRRFVPTRL